MQLAIDPISGDISCQNALLQLLRHMCLLNKVRDLAESRTGVSSKWVASFLHIFILIHEWSRFVWTSDKWFLSLQGNDAPSGNEIMLLGLGQQRIFMMPVPPLPIC